MQQKEFIIIQHMIIIKLAVDMHKEDLNMNKLIRYPLIKEEQIKSQN